MWWTRSVNHPVHILLFHISHFHILRMYCYYDRFSFIKSHVFTSDMFYSIHNIHRPVYTSICSVRTGLHPVHFRRICSRTRVCVVREGVIHIIYVCAKSLCYMATPIKPHSIIYTYPKYTPRCSRLRVFTRVHGIYYNSEGVPRFTIIITRKLLVYI